MARPVLASTISGEGGFPQLHAWRASGI